MYVAYIGQGLPGSCAFDSAVWFWDMASASCRRMDTRGLWQLLCPLYPTVRCRCCVLLIVKLRRHLLFACIPGHLNERRLHEPGDTLRANWPETTTFPPNHERGLSELGTKWRQMKRNERYTTRGCGLRRHLAYFTVPSTIFVRINFARLKLHEKFLQNALLMEEEWRRDAHTLRSLWI